MSKHLSLSVSSAQEPSTGAGRMPRSAFLKSSLFAGGTLLAGGVALGGLPRLSGAAPSPEMDVRILNFCLLLERLQAAFYEKASADGALGGELAEFAETVGAHEVAHVAFLEELLGDDAEEDPTFDFGDATGTEDAFARAALMLEETTAAAYIGQGANLTADKVLAAARIVSVEARHAAWLRDVLGRDPAPDAADAAKTEAGVMSDLEDTGFIR